MILPKNCKKCNSLLLVHTLESNDSYSIHEHLICNEDNDHPSYCITTKQWT